MNNLIYDHYKWSRQIRWVQLIVNVVIACVHFMLGAYWVIPIQLFFSIYVCWFVGKRLVSIAVDQLFDPEARVPNVTGKRRVEYFAAVCRRLKAMKQDPTLEALEEKLHFWIAKTTVMRLKNKNADACVRNVKLYTRLIGYFRNEPFGQPNNPP